jgi:hypothetical protein
MMANPEVDKFKVWPTQVDRRQFVDVVSCRSRDEVMKRHPQQYRPYARKPDPRPRMVEAYLYFYQQLEQFFLGSDNEQPLGAEVPLASRLEECFQTLKNALQVVVIDLDSNDDAQVIFETLNARGEPLLPADLLRNFIFLRAARHGESPEVLYAGYWQPFDDPFWRVEVKQGRLKRPRIDLFMQHFLSSRQMVEIPIKHLFVEYKFWIDRKRPFSTVREELVTLSRQGGHFRRIIEPKKEDVLYEIVTFLDVFDIRTAYPLLLAMLDSSLSDVDWQEISLVLESYLLRRAICAMTTKNYNRVFLMLTRNLLGAGMTANNLRKQLSAQAGDSGEWPSDEKFAEAWRTASAYQILSHGKIVHILKRLNQTYLTSRMETIPINGPLTIEHLMPQQWIEHWPLPDGAKGMTYQEVWTAPSDPRVEPTRIRDNAVQSFGNLTIVTQPLNSALSHSRWEVKKPKILESLLPINQALSSVDRWDEDRIRARSEDLLLRALRIWPYSCGTSEAAATSACYPCR